MHYISLGSSNIIVHHSGDAHHISTQWVYFSSLQGPPGAQGSTGLPGPPGPPGAVVCVPNKSQLLRRRKNMLSCFFFLQEIHLKSHGVYQMCSFIPVYFLPPCRVHRGLQDCQGRWWVCHLNPAVAAICHTVRKCKIEKKNWPSGIFCCNWK